MNWLADFTPPGIKKMFRHRDEQGDAMWFRCAVCQEMTFLKEFEAALRVCGNCDHHHRISPAERLTALFDGGTYERIATPAVPDDPLKFRDTKRYTDRLRDSRKKTGEQDAIVIAHGTVEGLESVVLVQNFDFMGGSMGMALGEGLLAAAETAIERRAPLVVFAASGGARMQEGILSLMQMPRTTIAVQMLRDAGLPYVVVLTHPTTGGVTASYAMLGDVHLAEPGALIGFAGPRVIEQTIREKLPDGFQRAEYLREKGMVDEVVARKDQRSTLSSLLRVLMKTPKAMLPAAEPDTDAKTVAAAPTPAEDGSAANENAGTKPENRDGDERLPEAAE